MSSGRFSIRLRVKNVFPDDVAPAIIIVKGCCKSRFLFTSISIVDGSRCVYDDLALTLSPEQIDCCVWYYCLLWILHDRHYDHNFVGK